MAADRALSPQVFQILLALADQDLHGYAIIQDIAARTVGQMTLTASTLYAALKRLLDEGLIRELGARPTDDDPRRRYYRITASGRAAGRAEAARLDALASMARAKRWLPGGRRGRS
jgi:DNA-binding PadR family transcriptional regulator